MSSFHFYLPLFLIYISTIPTQAGYSCSCSSGYYISGCYCSAGSCYDTCKSCPTGYYGNQNSYCTSNTCSGYNRPQCTACDAGKYNNQEAKKYSTYCESCSSTTWSSEGSESCTLCRNGYGKGSGSVCSKCAVGKYQDQKIHTNCKDCPHGKTTINQIDDGTGKSSADQCVGCELGSVVSGAPPDLQCTVCAAGQYRNTYSSNVGETCSTCIPGRYIVDDGISSTEHDDPSKCKTCPKGYQYSSPGGCEICEGGTYQSENDVTSVACKGCPVNTFLADDKLEAVAHDQTSDCK